MPSEQKVQELVYQMELGKWTKWVRLTVFIAVAFALFLVFILDPCYWGLYKGLQHPKAMDQAQIARELARGNGFSTQMIRPLALDQFKDRNGAYPVGKIPDTFYAPLWPVTTAPFLLAVKHWPESIIPFRSVQKDRWVLSMRDYIYCCDRAISAVGALFLLLSIILAYFTTRRLFDNHVAVWTVVLMLGCVYLWRWAQSGLPQMEMLFLFSCAMYSLVRAIEFQEEKQRWPFNWLVGTSAALGLLTLAHGIAFWVFLGTLVFCAFHFKGWRKTVVVMTLIYLLFTLPWLVHTYRVSGNCFGTSLYTALEQVRGSENSIMRSSDADFKFSPSVFRRKIQFALIDQFSNFISLMGNILVAPLFFLSLLHPFKSAGPRSFRWALLSMWLFASFGMGLFALSEETSGCTLSSNDLNVLFIPLFTAFGMAFLLVLWRRMEIYVAFAKYAFYMLIFFASVFPMMSALTTLDRLAVSWPPYYPPTLGLLRTWTQPREIIASDMPWAVAWYGDRKGLWLPWTIQQFLDINDYKKLGGPVAGIFLTPVSGNKGLISEIVKGDFRNWAPFVLRNVNVKEFPMRYVTPLPIDAQCIFYSDHDRWTEHVD